MFSIDRSGIKHNKVNDRYGRVSMMGAN